MATPLGPEQKVSIQTDRAWSELTKTMAHTAPRHLHNAQNAWRKIQAMTRGR